LFQVLYGYTKWDSQNAEELIVFNNRNNTLITIKDAHLITIMSTDSLAGDNLKIKAYKKEAFNFETNIFPVRNILWHKSDRILILDSLGLYNSKIKPSILIITQSPKVNLERLLTELKPKQVVADATNYKSYITRWKATCSKQKIPFHATTEKGFYRLE
jgi:competence protein ComEC